MPTGVDIISTGGSSVTTLRCQQANTQFINTSMENQAGSIQGFTFRDCGKEFIALIISGPVLRISGGNNAGTNSIPIFNYINDCVFVDNNRANNWGTVHFEFWNGTMENCQFIRNRARYNIVCENIFTIKAKVPFMHQIWTMDDSSIFLLWTITIQAIVLALIYFFEFV